MTGHPDVIVEHVVDENCQVTSSVVDVTPEMAKLLGYEQGTLGDITSTSETIVQAEQVWRATTIGAAILLISLPLIGNLWL